MATDATELYTDNRDNSQNARVPQRPETGNIRVLPVGTVLNSQYTIEKVLGEGGFGITYLGFDKYLKIRVAIKEYFPAQFATRNTSTGNLKLTLISGPSSDIFYKGLENFEKEANKLTKFNNLKGIVSVYNFFFENNTAYMVMEFVEGKTLKEYMAERGNKISWEETLKMMQSAISSLEMIHRGGIIHRDLSPDNIMISPNGDVTIIDFGSARYDDTDKSKTIVLKHGYAPPEQYYKKGNQGPWTDVYALCATMYYMITGVKLPNSTALLSKTEKRDSIRSHVKSIPQNVEKAIDRGIEPAIMNRIHSMEELEQYLYKNVKVKISREKIKKAVLFSAAAAALLVLIVCGVLIAGNSKKNVKKTVSETVSSSSVSKSETGISKNEDSIGEGKQEEKVIEESIPREFNGLHTVSSSEVTLGDADGGKNIVGVVSSVTEMIIPATIDGERIVSVEKTNTNVVNIALENGIESIQANAFRNCVYLEKVYIPGSLKEIGDNAFSNCLSLSGVVLSENNSNFYIEGNTLYRNDGSEVVSW